MTDVALAIKMTADASDASKALDDVAGAAQDMGDEVARAADKSDAAASKLDDVAGAADGVDSKMGAAAGSLGALSGGLEAAGFEGAAGSLGILGTATDTLSGASGLAALALENEKVQLVLAKAAAVGKTVADKAMAGASKAAAAGQWLLNAALSANPIGLIVLAVAALVGGLILAYKKSETFRNIVNGAMDAVKAGIQPVIDIILLIKDKIGIVADKVPGLSGVFQTMGTLVGGYIDLMLTPLNLVIDAVNKIIDLIGKIDFPSRPSWLGGDGRVAARGGFMDGGNPRVGDAGQVININLPGAVLVGSELEVARYIKRILGDDLRRLAGA